MNQTELQNSLIQAKDGSDFPSEAASITKTLIKENADLQSVAVILKFMENHAAIDFGTPGPLIHFVEKFYGAGYETELLASIARKPTSHTVWMLNRIINGARQPAERAKLIDVLRQIENHPLADMPAKRQANHFLQRVSYPK